ncbi:glycine-rich domain-containing protein-like [Sorangium sp. So ce185]|uniref:glycine-rich domain-containing protein n=1 Tax=Sorangium sp. So ce185 TaxID=3133287 RepID=UPI003F5EEC83
MKDIISVDLVRAALRSEELQSTPEDELAADVRDYEHFLLLAKEHPEIPIAPTKRIDRIWHLHMLHPKAYVADCMRLFGDILDHDGGFGGTREEEPVLQAMFVTTAALWEARFGEPYVGSVVACKRNCVSRCQRRCSSRATTSPRAPTS